ncbi:response regulator [Coleofasciculus sp. FACHB-712]|uniref:response regulator n=1 Tax=Coleofasciculus sp. FACHB-712 TaxID=2692789 RepID=UPI00168316DB|nr:response regulator [Coleofasciculus sp. FACHB-712]MBD1942524.1 response regulator [Coleofasciculus sp. FACHB-712]
MTKVLVIEDEEVIRESILDILIEGEFIAIGAENGSIGVQLAKELRPDLILCDVRMPELDGYEVLRALRSDPVTAPIPFIFLTADTTENFFHQGQLLGANGYLAKPFTTALLLKAIATHMRK